MMKQRNMDLVRRVVEEIWNGHDLDLADVLFAPTYINHGGIISDLIHGPEAIKIGVALYRTAFPSLHITVEALMAEEAMVELQWTAYATSAVLADDAATGAWRSLMGTTRSHLVNDQIDESWMSWDSTGTLRRLGIAVPET